MNKTELENKLNTFMKVNLKNKTELNGRGGGQKYEVVVGWGKNRMTYQEKTQK